MYCTFFSYEISICSNNMIFISISTKTCLKLYHFQAVSTLRLMWLTGSVIVPHKMAVSPAVAPMTLSTLKSRTYA